MTDTDHRTTRLSGPWTWEEAGSFLNTATVPMRLAANTDSGFPTVTPLWFLWQEGVLWAASKPDAGIVRLLRKDGRCAFDISVETPPYYGIRGQGKASVLPDGLAVLQTLLDRYVGEEKPGFRAWLLARSQDECAIRIEPARMTSWDFRQRMGR